MTGLYALPQQLDLDRAFLRRSIRTTLGLGAVLSLWLAQTLRFPVIGGFASGVLAGAGGLALTMWAVDQATRRDSGPRRAIPVAVMLAKLLALYLALRVLVWRWEFSPPAIGAGAGLIMVVIVLKVIGRSMTSTGRAGAWATGPRARGLA